VISRGHQREAIFRDQRCYEEFLKRLGQFPEQTTQRNCATPQCLMLRPSLIADGRGGVNWTGILLNAYAVCSQEQDVSRRYGQDVSEPPPSGQCRIGLLYMPIAARSKIGNHGFGLTSTGKRCVYLVFGHVNVVRLFYYKWTFSSALFCLDFVGMRYSPITHIG
jgi:hypothetical protein